MSDTGFTRRKFLQALPVLAGAVIASRGIVLADSAPIWTPIGKASDYPKGVVKRVALGHAEVIYVTHQANDTYLALWARCTHRGCVVNYDQQNQQYVCPCHGGKFSATGQNISGPPPSPLVQLKTQVNKDGYLSVLPPTVNSPSGR